MHNSCSNQKDYRRYSAFLAPKIKVVKRALKISFNQVKIMLNISISKVDVCSMFPKAKYGDRLFFRLLSKLQEKAHFSDVKDEQLLEKDD